APIPINAGAAPKVSTKMPVIGEPNAVPAVIAEPYQPIASPRRFSATRSVSHSEAADKVGAQRKPGKAENNANDQVSQAKYIGMVRIAMLSSRTSGEMTRFIEP